MRILSCMILVGMHTGETLAVNMCSKGTDKIVTSCPKNKTMWTEASERKNCSQFITKDCPDLQYHCVINAYGNGTVEVCAKPTYLQGFCAEYNPLRYSVKNHHLLQCTNFTNGRCPSRYTSTEAYKYQECFEIIKRSNSNSNSSSQHHHELHGQKSNGIAVVLSIIIIFIFISIPFCLVASFVIYHKIRHQKRPKEALKELPLFGSRISNMKCFQSEESQENGLNEVEESHEPSPGESVKIGQEENQSLDEQTKLLSKEGDEHCSKRVLQESGITHQEEEQSLEDLEQSGLLSKEDRNENNPALVREQDEKNVLEAEKKERNENDPEPDEGQSERYDKQAKQNDRNENTSEPTQELTERNVPQAEKKERNENDPEPDEGQSERRVKQAKQKERNENDPEPDEGQSERHDKQAKQNDRNENTSEPSPEPSERNVPQAEKKNYLSNSDGQKSILYSREERNENDPEPDEGQSERDDKQAKQKKMVLQDINEFGEMFVHEKDKRITEEDISRLAPKLQVLLVRLDELRPLPEKILNSVKRISSFLSPQKTTTMSSKFLKKVMAFKKSLKKTEEKVLLEFQQLAKEVSIHHDFLTVDENGSYGKRVDDLERKITKLEEMNKLI